MKHYIGYAIHYNNAVTGKTETVRGIASGRTSPTALAEQVQQNFWRRCTISWQSATSPVDALVQSTTLP